MSRDTRDDRPPLRASELPPNRVILMPGVRAVACPGCGHWQVPHHGRIRRHGSCPEQGRRVWFDLAPAQWQASLAAAARDGATRRGTRTHGARPAPTPPPLHRSRHRADAGWLTSS